MGDMRKGYLCLLAILPGGLVNLPYNGAVQVLPTGWATFLSDVTSPTAIYAAGIHSGLILFSLLISKLLY
jgi:hypothetical protein